MKHVALILYSSILVSACGSENDGTGEKFSGAAQPPAPASATESTSSFYVATMQAAPACTPDHEGWLIYVAAEASLKACTAGAWAVVPLPKGDKGDPGDPGAAGKDGTDNRIVASIHCVGGLKGFSIDVAYSVSQMSSGDVFSTATVADPQTGLGLSGTSFYSLQQKGFLTAPVVIPFDVAGAVNGGYFTMELDRKTLIQSVTYKDGDGEKSWSKDPDECIVNDYSKPPVAG